jgi:hypothetical protein
VAQPPSYSSFPNIIGESDHTHTSQAIFLLVQREFDAPPDTSPRSYWLSYRDLNEVSRKKLIKSPGTSPLPIIHQSASLAA